MNGYFEQPSTSNAPPSFAHPAERVFSEFLDRHGVKWEYEPTFLALDVDEHGFTTRAFVPDFYLPDLDLYVEITTANVGFNGRKRRKIRKAEEVHGARTILMAKTEMIALAKRYDLCYRSPRDEDVAIQSV